MPLYHATTAIYSEGELRKASGQTLFYPEAVSTIEAARPSTAPSRAVCFFAAERGDFAVYFLLRQGIAVSDVRLYEVELPISWRSPFAVVHAISQQIKAGRRVSVLVSEYWHPIHPWNFYEVFGPEMRIVASRDVTRTNDVVLHLSYSADFNTAQKLSVE